MNKQLCNGILLRDFEVRDKQGLLECMSELEVVQYTEWDPLTEESAEQLITWAISTALQNPRQALAYAIIGPDEQFIGCATLTVCDAGLREAYIGLITGKPHWGRGHGTAVGSALLAIGFEDLAMHRILVRTDPSNVGMQAVAHKLGFVLEGRLRECVYEKERWRDRLVYSMLDHEYRARAAIDPEVTT